MKNVEGKTVNVFSTATNNVIYLSRLKYDCSLWPAAQALNFLYVPPVYRVVYVNVVTVAWNVFLSYAKHFVIMILFFKS